MSPEQNINQECQKLEPLLDDYLHGELPRPAAEQLASHLEICGDCREALDDLRISARLVGGAFEPVGEPASAFARLVMARINTAESWLQGQRAFWRPFEAVAWRLAFSAALILAFLFAYGARVASQTQPAAVSTVSAQQRDILTVPASVTSSNSDEILMAVAERRHER
jgi:anti-sigma factor RsiW